MANYEQISCKAPKARRFAKYEKRRAVRATNKRICRFYVQGDVKRAEKENPNSHKRMCGWIN